MAGASADGELNPWPAFVDVLTTVIMVVTFLLVIMSAAVMMLSQRVVANFKQQLLAAQTHSTASGAKPAAPAACVAGANPLHSPVDAKDGTSISQLGSILKTETEINGRDQLSLRTRETKDTLKLAVKAIEEADNTKGVAVKTSDTLLNIAFEPRAMNYDPDNTAKVTAFIKAHPNPGATYEIWSFVPQVNSVSEAQRVAFYRAAMTRNLLVRAGVKPSAILTQIRLTDPKTPDGHNVRVVLKP